MKTLKLSITRRQIVLLLIVAATAVALTMMPANPAAAQDIREAARKAAADKEAARLEHEQALDQILSSREALVAEVERLEQQQANLEADLLALGDRITEGKHQRELLTAQWSQKELGFRELSGNVRVAARDLESLLKASPLSVGSPWRLETISPLLNKGYFPDIDDISGMTRVFFDEICRGGQVTQREGEFVGRDGQQTTGSIYQLGKFTSIYQTPEEVGFLNWSPDGRQMFALSQLPNRSLTSSLSSYLSGDSENVPIDMSGGAALRQVTHQTSLLDQLRAGGPIVWPILLIAITALFIVIYKIIFLNRMHGNTDRIMGEVNTKAAKGDWAACDKIVHQNKGKKMPVVRVIRAGLEVRDEERETIESVLQESILRELPIVQRGIAFLAVLGAVAPLLGLLGTVTGMIDTFRVITLFGTGDPKLMSGGISEALVTTELGLAVAIPIMLVHTFLSRRSDHLIGDMEEKAVQLVNIIQKRKYLQEAEDKG